MTIVHSVFSVMAGLVVEILFMLFSVYNRLKMSEYEVYWLGFSTNNLLGTRQEIIMISQKNQANNYKKKLVIYKQ